MKTTLLSLFCLIAVSAMAGNYEVSSPNGKVKVVVNTDEAVKWSVSYNGHSGEGRKAKYATMRPSSSMMMAPSFSISVLTAPALG